MPNTGDIIGETASTVSRHPLKENNNQCAQLVRVCVAEAFDVPVEGLTASSRGSRAQSRARQAAMYLTHVVFGMSLTGVGREFGRDRSTVAHACSVIEWNRDDAAFDRLLNSLEHHLRTAYWVEGEAAHV